LHEPLGILSINIFEFYVRGGILRLTTKYTAITGTVLLVMMTLFAYLNIQTLESVVLEDSLNDVDKLSETIIRTTHYQMLEDDRKRVYQMMEEVGSQKGIERIRLLNKEGMVSYSTDASEIGMVVDEQSQGCSGCHRLDVPLVNAPAEHRSRMYKDDKGKLVLAVTREILNRPVCSQAACHEHPPEAAMLGVLDVHISLDRMMFRIREFRINMISFAIFSLIVIGAVLIALTQKMVNAPVRSLLYHTRRLASGDLEERQIAFSRSDEMGELTKSFKDLTYNLKTARSELEEWNRHLEEKVEARTREIGQMQAQLIRSEKLASLGELVAGIAHEINNPLTGILVFSTLMRDKPGIDPAMHRDLQTVVQETERCARIVRGLLEFSRESRPRKEWVDLHEIIERAVSLIERQAFYHDVRIIRSFSSLMPLLPIDGHQIEQVFVNILVNAGHAMKGKGEMKITTELEETAAVIHFADDGCGISKELLERIFDPFFTTKEAEGTGLGLSVSYGIIESHGGKIEVRSTVGEGTIFTVRLPLKMEAEPKAEVEVEE
jgi:two-component system, NtrC family, sensor kinase